MNGLKFKRARKRAEKDNLSLSDQSQKNRLIKIPKAYIVELGEESFDEFALQEQEMMKTRKTGKPAATRLLTSNTQKESEELVKD